MWEKDLFEFATASVDKKQNNTFAELLLKIENLGICTVPCNSLNFYIKSSLHLGKFYVVGNIWSHIFFLYFKYLYLKFFVEHRFQAAGCERPYLSRLLNAFRSWCLGPRHKIIKSNCQEYEKKEKISELNVSLNRESPFCYIRVGTGFFMVGKMSFELVASFTVIKIKSTPAIWRK